MQGIFAIANMPWAERPIVNGIKTWLCEQAPKPIIIPFTAWLNRKQYCTKFNTIFK